MRFFLIILLCAPLILSASDEDPTNNNNEISVDEPLDKQLQDPIDSDESNANDVDRDNEIIEDEDESLSLDEIYKNSVQAYLDEDWDGCIVGFNRAIKKYRKYRKTIIKCRRECSEKAAGTEPLYPNNIEDLHFYEKKVRETLCLLNCNQDYRDVAGAKSLKRLSLENEVNFVQRAPYEYLHICYYQRNHFQDAANAVYTYLVFHPKHEMSQKNLRYYISLPDVSTNDVANLEAEPFVKMYIQGVTSYDDENYREAVRKLENSIVSYLKSEEDCRFYCEGHFDQGWLPEFTPSVANHFAYCLKCKYNCAKMLNNINGEYHADLLPSHYHYLQFAYYKLGDVKKACAAVASYLLFYPADGTMRENQEYYASLPKVDESYFEPREEAVKFIKRQQYEGRLLLSITEEFAAIGSRLNAAKKQLEKEELELEETQLTNDPPPGHSPAFQLRLPANGTIEWKEEKKLAEEKNSLIAGKSEDIETRKIRIVADEEELGGKERYLAERFLNETECEALINLAQIGAVEGDGYEGNASPHSSYERFEGLTIGRAALMVYFGLIDWRTLELALESSEAARDHVERYFNLDRHLYFTYTHLACRSALPDSPSNRQDLSHAIHADNCIVADDGSCAAEWPAYTFRDYSAIIYLNDNFEGGEFVFAGDNKARVIESTVEPRCGSMVAFSADGRNLHGVRGILRGKRCALGLWFTFDKEHLEIERILARAIIQRVRDDGFVKPKENESVTSARYEDTLSQRFEQDEKLSHLFKTLESS